MRAVVVFESMFGNTRRVAEAVADGLRETYDVSVSPISDFDANACDGVDLMVMGAPTHVHGLSRPASRNAARDQAAMSREILRFEPVADGPGIREELARLRVLRCGVAAFDTRLAGPGWVTGRASRRIARTLVRCGARLVLPPESFIVDKHNQLKPGELIRARTWGTELAAASSASERRTATTRSSR